MFIKLTRGHEDGCINGVCDESHAGQYAEGAVAAAGKAHTCHWVWRFQVEPRTPRGHASFQAPQNDRQSMQTTIGAQDP